MKCAARRNARSESPAHRRLTTVSPDGVGHWTSPEFQSQLVEQGWQWFCAHAYTPMNAMAWSPSGVPAQGDNLMSYLHLCLGILGKEGDKLR